MCRRLLTLANFRPVDQLVIYKNGKRQILTKFNHFYYIHNCTATARMASNITVPGTRKFGKITGGYHPFGVIVRDRNCLVGGVGGTGGKGEVTGGTGGKGGSFKLTMAIQTQYEFGDIDGKSQVVPGLNSDPYMTRSWGRRHRWRR